MALFYFPIPTKARQAVREVEMAGRCSRLVEGEEIKHPGTDFTVINSGRLVGL